MFRYRILFVLLLALCETNAQFIKSFKPGVSVVLTKSSVINVQNSISSIHLGEGFHLNRLKNPFITSNHKSEMIEEIIDSWIPADGLNSLRSIEEIQRRIDVNLSDRDISLLASSARGMSNVKDEVWLNFALTNNYILVLDFEKIVSEEEFTRIKDNAGTVLSLLSGGGDASTKRAKEGYFGKIRAHIYHIQVSDIHYFNFWKNWDDDFAHLRYKYPITHVKSIETWVDGTQSISTKSHSDLYQLLLDEAARQALIKFGESNLSLTYKIPISNIDPIRARLGSEHGVEKNDRFSVYKLKESKSGEIILKKSSTVRLKQLAIPYSNKRTQKLESKFYKVSYGAVKGGMFLIANDDKGIAISLGMGTSPFEEYKASIGFDLFKIFSLKKFPNWRLYLELGYAPLLVDQNDVFAQYSANNGQRFLAANEMKSVKYGLGVELDYYLMPWLQVTPYVALLQEYMTYTNKDLINEILDDRELLRGYGTIWHGQIGVRLPINLAYNIKIVPSVGYSSRNFNNSTSLGGVIIGDYSTHISTDKSYIVDLQIRLEL